MVERKHEPGRELPATITKANVDEVAAAFVEACWSTNLRPNHDLIVMLLAHSALETGHWQRLRAYNFGNVKATNGWIAGGGAYTYYEASENLSAAQTDLAMGKAKPRTDGESGLDAEIRDSPIQAGGSRTDGRYSVWFWPSHEQARFRAFETLADGAAAYVAKLLGRYATALTWAMAGNAERYVDELHRNGYFTAGLDGYRKTVARLFKRYWRTTIRLADPVEEHGEALHPRDGEPGGDRYGDRLEPGWDRRAPLKAPGKAPSSSQGGAGERVWASPGLPGAAPGAAPGAPGTGSGDPGADP